MKPRGYQNKAVESVEEALKRFRSALVVMPTGTGKTVVFSHLVRRLVRPTKRAMVIAHREELINQAAEKLHAVTGEWPDIEMADQKADSHLFRRTKVIVASVQTLITGRMDRFNPADFGLLITDEAHHAPADSYRKIYKHMLSAGCQHVGVTATPDRHDEAALGTIFESAPFTYELPDAIADGYLVPIHQHIAYIKGLDYSKVSTTAGDLNQGEVAKVQSSEKVIIGMADTIIKVAGDKRTIVFATPGSMKAEGDEFHIAEKLCEVLNRYRPDSAVRISQDTPKIRRKQLLAEYRAGRFQFLVNVGVFTEGFDEPGVEVVAITRPTKVRALYAQMVGRGTRPLPGVVDQWDRAEDRVRAIADSAKPCVTIIDFAGNPGRHKLITSADILGGKYSDEVVARAKKKAESGVPGDVSEALKQSAQEIADEQERERVRRAGIIGQATYELHQVDPFDVYDIEANQSQPTSKGRGATEKQIALLRKFHVDIPPDLTIGRAGQLISECMNRRAAGRASYAQVKALKKLGLPTDVSAAQAAIALGEGAKFVDLTREWESRMNQNA